MRRQARRCFLFPAPVKAAATTSSGTPAATASYFGFGELCGALPIDLRQARASADRRGGARDRVLQEHREVSSILTDDIKRSSVLQSKLCECCAWPCWPLRAPRCTVKLPSACTWTPPTLPSARSTSRCRCRFAGVPGSVFDGCAVGGETQRGRNRRIGALRAPSVAGCARLVHPAQRKVAVGFLCGVVACLSAGLLS